MAGKEGYKKTNAMRLLDREGVAYEVLQYEWDGARLEGELVADQLGLSRDQVFKTLVLRDEKGQPLVCCIPVHFELNTKALAAAWGSKSVEMIHVKELLPLTGYVRGGCSPVGMKKRFPAFVDERALQQERISVSAGQRGLQLFLPPEALISYMDARLGFYGREK